MSAPTPQAQQSAGGPPRARPPTEVCLTVDTEFSIGGAFADPQRYRPLSRELVECVVDGRGEGLGFILRALKEHAIPATFFVEVLQSCYFGDKPMGRIAERIADAGHDLQLHLHPAWLHFRKSDWGSREPESDSCARRSLDELREMIELGFSVFGRWGVPSPIALRTGSFSCNRVVHQAMVQGGLELGANIALAAYRPADPEFQLVSGSALIDGVLEIPVLTYSTPHLPTGSRLRPMAITATSWLEMEALLWQARAAEISPVVVLTHPFEFVKRTDFRYRELRRNRVNQQRLEHLLEFLRRHDDDFAATTFARSGAAWVGAGGRPGRLLRMATHLAVARSVQNLLNTHVWRY